jgi:nucleoid DNA-binding protein
MMPFTQRLQFLLEKYDALILHGFGAFYARYQTAQWHPVTHRIIPPQKEISFNRSIAQTDGVLENEFKSTFDLTTEESHELVQGMVQFLLEELEQQKRLVFEGVGELVVRPDESWRFIPFEENHILPESFGLAPVQVRPVLRNSSPTPQLESVFEEAPGMDISPKKFPWRAIAASIVLVIFTGTLFWMNPFSDGSTDAHHTAQLVQTQPSSSFDSLKEEPQQKSAEPTSLPNVEAKEDVKIEDPKAGFYIIVGSTTSESEAIEKAKSLHWMALNFPEIGRFRLATEHFDTRNEALEALEKVRLDVDSEAWILKH